MRRTLVLISIFVLINPCFAVGQQFDECFDSASQKYAVNKSILKAIAKTESNFNPVAINGNANGTQDIGLMQINTFWLPKLAKYQITRQSLFDGCTSIHVGAWVLSQNIATYGATWKAVGAYNASNTELQQRYAAKVYLNYINGN
jgi:soluble lytic murein transglycosylase-like protein